MSRPICDIIVPVYNSLSYVAECLDSILMHTQSDRHHLIVIDDASDAETGHYLEQFAVQNPFITLYRNSENEGFVRSCNKGIMLGDAPYVVLVNSDVVVTPNWLEPLIACAESDLSIATVNPFTNHADWIDLPLVPGANFLGMNYYLQRGVVTPGTVDIVTGVGFCLLLRRSVLRELGAFDEIYGHGYCEESDLCMRFTTHGYRTVVAVNVYVYHQGRGTFSDRSERYHRNRAIFDARWSKEYRRQFRAFRRAAPFNPIRIQFASPRQRWDPIPVVWETARTILATQWRYKWLSLVRFTLKSFMRTLTARRPLATPEFVSRFTRPGVLRVTYLLPRLVISGGVLSVIQLVNQLILLGIEARIVALFEDPAVHDWTPLYTRPMIFRNERELLHNFPHSDLVVATLWKTAPWAAELVERGRARTAAYLLQDYEPWFFPETEPDARERVRATYPLISHRIVMSDWLQQMLKRDGYTTHKIRLGMNLKRFYPRDVTRGAPIVLAMARPGTPYRGFEPTIAALAQIKALRPDVNIVLFGERNLSRQSIPFSYQDEGVIFDQERLARLYSEAYVFLDGSDFQGFGRCGLEAMACGTATVLTDVGGVNEYARHEYNTLLAPPQSPDQFAENVLRLLNQPTLREQIVKAGLETVRQYCHRREAWETLKFFKSIL